MGSRLGSGQDSFQDVFAERGSARIAFAKSPCAQTKAYSYAALRLAKISIARQNASGTQRPEVSSVRKRERLAEVIIASDYRQRQQMQSTRRRAFVPVCVAPPIVHVDSLRAPIISNGSSSAALSQASHAAELRTPGTCA